MATPESQQQQQLLLRAEAERADRAEARADLAEERAGLAEVRAGLAEERAGLAEARAAAEAAAHQALLARLVFHIQVLEHHDRYDSESVPFSEPELAVATFLRLCREYVCPDEVAQEDASYSASVRGASYADCSGNDDKPKLVTMTGPLTEAMLAALEEGIEDLYLEECECGAKYPSDDPLSAEWAMCRPCLEKMNKE